MPSGQSFHGQMRQRLSYLGTLTRTMEESGSTATISTHSDVSDLPKDYCKIFFIKSMYAFFILLDTEDDSTL